MEFESQPTTWTARIKIFVAECSRVLKVTRKPDSFEFKTIVKVSAMGIGVIGLLGFTLFFLKEIFIK